MTRLLRRAIIAAYGKRAIIVAAAGNGGARAPSAFPAAYDEVIAVTATDVADRVYASANRGDYVAVAAPGVDILAPALKRAHLLHTGTSFAAAHVSGIIALMVGRAPKLAAGSVLDVLGKTAGDLGQPGRDEVFGAGRVNAFKSLTLIRKSRRTSQVSQMIKTPILIVGAGPTGLMLSAQLHRFGAPHVIVDRKAGVTEASKALAVQARTLEQYRQLGIAETAIRDGFMARSARFIINGRVRANAQFGEIGAGLSPYPFLFILEQSRNEALLLDHIKSQRRQGAMVIGRDRS